MTSSGDMNSLLKNFIYLDEAKLNSYISQLFSGVTEYLLSSSEKNKQNEETQKGEVLSGKILRAIFQENENTAEKKFLYDYSYQLFEDKLFELNAVVEINQNTQLADLEAVRFVKIKSRVKLLDYSVIIETLNSFPQLLESMLIASSWEELQELKQNQPKGKNPYSAKRQEIKHLSNKDAEQQEALSYLLSFWYESMFAIQAEVNETTYTAELKRDHLREDAQLITRKYSRLSEKEFSILGTISLKENIRTKVTQDDIKGENLRLAIKQLIELYTDVENNLWGILPNEVIIDPIAVYIEI